MSEPTHLKDLTPDPANARKHTPRNVGTIADALREVGAARSIVIDEDGVILAGNATVEAAAEAGLTRVQVVDVDGQTVVAVRRSGLTPEQKARLALFDNRAAELAEGWDVGVLQQMQADGVSLEGLWTSNELDVLIPRDAPAGHDTLESQFHVLIECRTESEQTSLLQRFLAEGLTCKALVS